MNAHHSERELRAMGFIRAHDGYLLDNRDGFYDDYPDNHVGTYDNRTSVPISVGLLQKLVVLAAATPGHQLQEVA